MLIGDGHQYRVHMEDCIMHMATMPDACIDMSHFSPPSPALQTPSTTI